MFFNLFVVSFVSATLWPMASEAVFIFYLHQNTDALLLLLTTASIGNSLGSIAMFELALRSHSWLEKKIQSNAGNLNVWVNRLSKYGSPLLVFTWIPIVGDFMPIAGGVLGMNRVAVYSWLLVGKTARYGVLTLMMLSVQ